MNTNIIEVYFEFCKKNILNYNRLLLKYLNIEDDLLKKVSIEKIDKVVYECYLEKYFNDKNPRVINIDLEIMLSLSKKRHPDLDFILAVLNKQIVSLDKLDNNIDLVRLYKILSNSILIAIELNERTCSIAIQDCSFKNVISIIQDKYNGYLEPEVVDKLLKPMPLLREEYNRKSKIKDKLILHYNNNKIDFEGFEIVDIFEQTKWFQIKPKYNFEKLKLTSKRKIVNIVYRQNYLKDIMCILLDKLNYEILKQLVARKNVSNYIVTLPNDFLKTKTNVNNLIKILNNTESKQHIYLEIQYSQLRKYTEYFQKLKSNNISIIVSEIGKQYSKELIEQIDFISIKSDLIDERLLKIIRENSIVIMLENYQNDIDYPNEVRLIRNQVNSKIISKEKMV